MRVESRVMVPCYLLPGPTRGQGALEPVDVSTGSACWLSLPGGEQVEEDRVWI